jgi:hypothetical protein
MQKCNGAPIRQARIGVAAANTDFGIEHELVGNGTLRSFGQGPNTGPLGDVSIAPPNDTRSFCASQASRLIDSLDP